MTLRSNHRLGSLVVLAAPLLLGCPGDDAAGDGGSADSSGMSTSAADDSTGATAPFDEAEVIAQAGDYATTLVKVNAQDFPSQHGLAATVNVYVNPEAEALYRSVDPAAPAEVAWPEGTLVVKEHLDGTGAFDGYLMMYKGPEGYSPEGGDWFWARVDGDLVTHETGAVGFCISCHTPASSFVFGVAAADQG